MVGDSMLDMSQATGTWDTLDEKFKVCNDLLKLIINKFKRCSFIHRVRDDNEMADDLSF